MEKQKHMISPVFWYSTAMLGITGGYAVWHGPRFERNGKSTFLKHRIVDQQESWDWSTR